MASTPSSTACAASVTSARVGRGDVAHRLEDLGREDDRHAALTSRADQAFLHGGHGLERYFDAEIAARDHQPVGDLENLVDVLDGLRLFNLGDDRQLWRAGRRRGRAHGPNVVGRLDEAEGDQVDAHGDARTQVFNVLGRQRRRANRSGHVDALVTFEDGVGEYARHQPPGRDVHDVELDRAVVDEQALARRDRREQRIERARHPVRPADELPAFDHQRLGGTQPDGRIERADTNLRTGQVLQNGDVAMALPAPLHECGGRRPGACRCCRARS